MTAQINYEFRSQLFQHGLAIKTNDVTYLSMCAPLLTQWHHLVSALRSTVTPSRWVTLIDPPFIPNDRYLREIGLGDSFVRIVRLNKKDTKENARYIQQCIQNGKSSLVAVWANREDELPDIFDNERPVACKTLIFSNAPNIKEHQLEMLF